MWPESTHHFVVVGTRPAYAGIAQQIASLVFGSKLAPWFHMVAVVDHNTDIFNKDEVIHALCTKCHPGTGIHIYRNHTGTPLNPFVSVEDRKVGRGAKVLFDCLFPIDWKVADTPILVSFAKAYPKEIQEKVLANWTNYGFKD